MRNYNGLSALAYLTKMVYNTINMSKKRMTMFGYLQVQKSELLVREWEAYRSVYCGLCKQMGKNYSFLTRLSLSYDCTFYAMLLMSLHRSCKGFDNGRCTFNPLKKCRFARCADSAYSKAAAFSVISAFYKLQDDLSDSSFAPVSDENQPKRVGIYRVPTGGEDKK